MSIDVYASISFTSPCEPSTQPDYNNGATISLTGRFSVTIPDASTFKITYEHKAIKVSADCPVSGRISQSTTQTGPITFNQPGDITSTVTVSTGVYRFQAKVTVEKKVGEKFEPPITVALKSCIFTVGGATAPVIRARITNLKPCGVDLPVGQQITGQDSGADFEVPCIEDTFRRIRDYRPRQWRGLRGAGSR